MHRPWLYLILSLFCTQPAVAKLQNAIEASVDKCAIITSEKIDSDQGYKITSLEEESCKSALQINSSNAAENSFFKLVSADSEDAIKKRSFDANNVLYHLTKAHEYFLKLATQIRPDSALDRKILVRLDLNKAFDAQKHFSEKAEFNSARYIPRNGSWNEEIWFHSRKQGLEDINWYDTAENEGQAVYEHDWVTLGILEPAKTLAHFNFGMDAAKLPDLIYLEAFYAAVDSPGLLPDPEKKPISLNLGSYLASSINEKNSFLGLKEFAGESYELDFSKIVEVTNSTPTETKWESFLPSFLWKIRDQLGQEKADQLVWNTILELRESDHYSDIPGAMERAAKSYRALGEDDVLFIEALLMRYQGSFQMLEEKFQPGQAKAVAKIVVDTIHPLPQKNISPPPPAPQENFFTPIFRGAAYFASDIGYVGTIIDSTINAPIDFGADLVSGLFFGKGVISTSDTELPHQLVAAIGGIGIYEGGLALAGGQVIDIVNPLGDVTSGLSIFNSIFCSDAEPSAPDVKNQYCKNTFAIKKSVTNSCAGLGAGIGIQLRNDLGSLSTLLPAIN